MVHSHQQSPGESSPIRLTKTWQRLFGLLIMAMRRNVYPSAESSPVQSRESYRVKSLDAACSIFVSQTLVTRGDGCYFALENGCRKVYSFS
jgi:hypothetical protein